MILYLLISAMAQREGKGDGALRLELSESTGIDSWGFLSS